MISVHPDVGSYTIKDDIIIMPVWTESYCAELIDICNKADKYIYDAVFGTTEVWLNTIDPNLVTEFGDFYKVFILPIIRREWVVMDLTGLLSPYVLKFTPNESTHIKNHTDSSIVSMHVKLNDTFTGGELVFPRQQVDNSNVPVGHAVLFPSMVTHPHHSKPVTSGERYALSSFTFWDDWSPQQKQYRF